MRSTWILLVCALLGLGACADDVPESTDTSEAARMLPDAFYSAWEHMGTSGGLDGQQVPAEEGKRARIVLTRENTLERHGPGGQVNIQPFTVRRGKTIFSAEAQWMIVFEIGHLELVVRIGPDGNLETSENVYDGFSSSYRRVESPR